ncbi:MAG TPA: hypothetical protein VFK89_07900, partial [Actinomycetota bacterium]|nr:hypothetical protein [Actinomycetota bacterium]
VRISAAALAMGAVVWFGVVVTDRVRADATYWLQAGVLLVLVAVGTAVYLGAARMARVQELSYVVNLLRRRSGSAPP